MTRIRFAPYALPLALAACSSGGTSTPTEIVSTKQRETTPSVSADQLGAAASGERAFGIDLYKQLATGNTDNLFFSPHSIDEALSMTYAGAKGATASQMRATLQYQLSDDQINAAMNALDLQLESRGQGQTGVDGTPFALRVSNALWGQEGFTFLPTFLDTLAVNYGAGVHPLDFKNATETSRTTINDWVAAQTNDKILNLIPEGGVTPDTKLVLTNAVYFNASWASPFDASATANAAFTRLDGTTVQAPLMHTHFEGSGLVASGVKAVEIPYAGNELSMIVIQPDDLASFESTLTADSLDTLVGQLASAEVTVALPKWKLTDEHLLAQPLGALGMTDAFIDKADFSGIDGANDLAIQDVVHKAYVAVDEKGTEAAAATAVIVGTTSIEQNQIDVTFDHPFLYLIRDNATGAVVFFGRITDPTK